VNEELLTSLWDAFAALVRRAWRVRKSLETDTADGCEVRAKFRRFPPLNLAVP